MKRIFLYVFAGIQIAIPLFLAVAVGYDSGSLFLFHLLQSAATAFVCCIIAELLRGAENNAEGAETFRAQLAAQNRRIETLEKKLAEIEKKER